MGSGVGHGSVKAATKSWRERQKVSRLQMEDCRDLGQRVK